jgi:hypothetical protein
VLTARVAQDFSRMVLEVRRRAEKQFTGRARLPIFLAARAGPHLNADIINACNDVDELKSLLCI